MQFPHCLLPSQLPRFLSSLHAHLFSWSTRILAARCPQWNGAGWRIEGAAERFSGSSWARGTLVFEKGLRSLETSGIRSRLCRSLQTLDLMQLSKELPIGMVYSFPLQSLVPLKEGVQYDQRSARASQSPVHSWHMWHRIPVKPSLHGKLEAQLTLGI